MSKYDFEKLNIISKDLGSFMPLEEYEPDMFIRNTQYPHVFLIKKDIFTYVNPDNRDNPIIRTVITKKLKAPKGVLDRYLNWKPFGKAVNAEPSKVCEPVFIEPYNKLTEDIQNNNKPFLSNSLYKPKQDYAGNTNETHNKPKMYKPSTLTLKKVTENTFSLIVKNFSIDKSRDDIEQSLFNLFSQYGDIKRLNVLINKNNGKIKDIAFIDFYKQSDVNNILESNNRFILDNMILTVEKNNKK
uniref:RRM domain-containing protein n=1 Tax=viral metagenome TaxID=1070528 RepID=A0A6C0IXK3_9ZZZZ